MLDPECNNILKQYYTDRFEPWTHITRSTMLQYNSQQINNEVMATVNIQMVSLLGYYKV